MAISDLDRVIASGRRRMARKDVAFQARLARMYGEAMNEIFREQKALARYVDQQKAKGAPVSPSWISREQRYLALQSRLFREAVTWGNTAINAIGGQAINGVIESGAVGFQEARAAGVLYPGFTPDNWAVINKNAIYAAANLIDHELSPLKALLERDLPEAGLAEFRSQWMTGLLLGRNPLKIASLASRNITQLQLGRAELIARTEFHRAYRAGKVEQYKQLETVTGWVWRAALDARTCAVCWAMHGTKHPKNEMQDGHPNCRCTMIPITGDWDPGVGDTGEERFSRLSPEQQMRMLGPTRFQQYLEGRSLSSMIGQRPNAVWGTMRALEPLSGAWGSRSRIPVPAKQVDMDLWKNPVDPYADVGGYNASLSALDDSMQAWADFNGLASVPYLASHQTALSTYQGSGYKPINYTHRGRQIPSGYEMDDDAIARYTASLDDAIKMASLKQTTIAYRGTGISAFKQLGITSVKDLNSAIGRTISEPGFLSTSVGGGGFGGMAVNLVLTVPKGTNAVWMNRRNVRGYGQNDPYGAQNGEAELLLGRNTRIVIDRVEGNTVYGRVLP